MAAASIETQARSVDNIDSRLARQISKEFTGGTSRMKGRRALVRLFEGDGAAIAKKFARGSGNPPGGNGRARIHDEESSAAR